MQAVAAELGMKYEQRSIPVKTVVIIDAVKSDLMSNCVSELRRGCC